MSKIRSTYCVCVIRSVLYAIRQGEGTYPDSLYLIPEGDGTYPESINLIPEGDGTYLGVRIISQTCHISGDLRAVSSTYINYRHI